MGQKFNKYARGAYDAIVYIDGSEVVAEDANGRKIASGVAGPDDTTVIHATRDFVSTGDLVKFDGAFVFLDTVDMSKSLHLDFTAAEIRGSVNLSPLLRVQGSTTTVTTLAADGTIGSKNIEVVDASGLIIGDYILITADTAWDAVAYPTIYQGEIHQIQNITDTTVTLDNCLWDGYLTSASARISKISLLQNPSVVGGNWIGSGESAVAGSAVLFNFVRGGDIRFGKFSQFGDRSLNIWNTIYTNIHHNVITENVLAGTGYAIAVVAASHAVNIHDNQFKRNRHHVTMGGDTTHPGVPRFISVDHNDCIESTSAGLDAHSVSDYIKFSNNTIIDAWQDGLGTYGYISTGAVHSIISGNTCRGSNAAYAFRVRETKNYELVVEKNHVFGLGGLAVSSPSIKRFSMNNNTLNGEATTYYGISVQSLSELVSISNNLIFGYTGSGAYGIYVATISGQNVNISKNLIYNTERGIWLNNALYCNIVDNDISASNYAIRELNTSDYNQIERNIIRSTGISTLGTHTRVKNNVGYATEASGSSAGTGSEQTIAHGVQGVTTANSIATIEIPSIGYKGACTFDATNIKPRVKSGLAFNWTLERVV
jgi:hypothetical protein